MVLKENNLADDEMRQGMSIYALELRSRVTPFSSYAHEDNSRFPFLLKQFRVMPVGVTRSSFFCINNLEFRLGA